MARHHYPEAAKTAIIVASEEQINGMNFNTRLLSVCLCIICMTSEVHDSTSAIHCMMSAAVEMDHHCAFFNSLKFEIDLMLVEGYFLECVGDTALTSVTVLNMVNNFSSALAP